MLKTEITTGIISRNRTNLEPLPTDAQPILHSLPEIRAVLFDIYGTLLISSAGDIQLEDPDESLNTLSRALAKVGISTTVSSRGLHDHYLQTLKRHQDIRRNAGVEYPEVEIRAVWRDFVKEISGVDASEEDTEQLATWYEVWTNPTDLMPGASELLLKMAHSSLQSGIISNAQFYTKYLIENYTGQTLESLGIPSYLTAFSYEYLEGKPGISMFESSAKCLLELHNILPHETLFVGNDCLKDLYPAKKVGFRTALFAGDSRSLRLRKDDPRCKNLKPDLVITELLQLVDCLPGLATDS